MATQSCRLCDESNSKMFNIFEKNVFDIEIVNMIKDCLPILIYEDDPFSKFICHSCNESLNMFCEFKKCCLEICQKQHEELQTKHQRTEQEEAFLHKVARQPLQNGIRLESNHDATEERDEDEEEEDDEDNMSQCEDEGTQNGSVTSSTRRQTTTPHALKSKPLLVGPASMTRKYTMVEEYTQRTYQPKSLLELLVRYINLQNLEDYTEDPWTVDLHIVTKLVLRCRYCEETFEHDDSLAMHEMRQHIRLELEKVDAERAWNQGDEEFRIRNEWFNRRHDEFEDDEEDANDEDNEEEEEDEDEDMDIDPGANESPAKSSNEQLLVPLAEEKEEEPEETEPKLVRFGPDRCPVYYVGTVPYVNGQPLKSLPKDARNSCYMSVKVNGMKRKLCPLCRYTFKDNWAIDTHYLTLGCYYTCRYCGIKFKRSKPEFQPHIDIHIQSGHKLNMDVFLARDGTGPRQVSVDCLETYKPLVVSTPRQPAPLPPACSMKLRERSLLIKQEPLDYLDSPPYAYSKRKRAELTPEKTAEPSQAYYCKKCYQVFGKVNNYNMHIRACNPSNGGNFSSGGSTGGRNAKPMPALAPLKNKSGMKMKREVDEYESFPCFICNSVFDSIYSRNSHMRIHTKQANARNARAASPPAKKMRHENYEPIVEIHEMTLPRVPSSVTIIPVKKKQSASSGISDDILKMVQNNPSITLKPREPAKKQTHNNHSTTSSSDYGGDMDDSDGSGVQSKSYKCSSCGVWFPNKSSLYFHKKSDCTGARYPCPFCKQRFTTPNEYSSHIFYSHPE